MALRSIVIFLVATAVGSTLPEFGDVLAVHLKIAPHFFNFAFLILGGLLIGLACYLGHNSSRKLS